MIFERVNTAMSMVRSIPGGNIGVWRALRGTMMTINSGAGGYVSFLFETLDRHDWASVHLHREVT